MNTKITGFEGLKPASAITDTARAKGASKSDEAIAPTAPTDTVKFTAQASQLQSLESRLATIPVADPKRIESVRLALSEGRFQIDPMRIAARLIDSEKALS